MKDTLDDMLELHNNIVKLQDMLPEFKNKHFGVKDNRIYIID